MPLWPDWMKQGTHYLSWVGIALLVLLLLLEAGTGPRLGRRLASCLPTATLSLVGLSFVPQ